MATVTPTTTYSDKIYTVTWTGIVTGDTVVSAEIAHSPSDLIMQVFGTFNGGTSATMTGSVDDTNFVAGLVDVTGTAVAFTAAGGASLRDAWRYFKPAVASGSADSVTVLLLARIL